MMGYSAGILLYIQNGNTLHVLLGKDVKYNLWSDFGGSCEEHDRNDSIKTASREFFEETMGIISDECDLRFNLKQRSICLECESFKKNRYYMYLLDANHVVQSRSVIDDFYYQQFLLGKNRSKPFNKFKEKYQIGWFSLEYILENPPMFREVFYTSIVNNLEKIRTSVKMDSVDA
jgi:predicted NUDIX family NTP pyrophosphohydrolase